MTETKDILDSISQLAKLGPYPSERKNQLKREFENILNLFQVLNNLSSHAKEEKKNDQEISTPLREDIAQPSQKRHKIISNFPDKEAALLKVPKVIEG